MAKKYIIYANGIDLAKCPITQNEVGRYYWNGSTYYKPTLDVFDTVKPPSGYKTYENGSHLKYKTNHLRNPIDVSLISGTKITMNVDVTVLSTNPGDGSWCKTVINGTNINPAFVHTYRWATGLVKAGSTICQIAPKSVTGFPDHLHMDIWGSYLVRNLILQGDVKMAETFKIGDYVTFTGSMNLRKGAGDGFGVSTGVPEGAVGRIKDGPRSSQNKLFYGKGSSSNVNDSYTWWDIQFLDTSGWMAQTNRFVKSSSTKMTNSDGTIPTPPPTEPVPPSELDTLRKQVADLTAQIKGLKDDLAASQKEVKEKIAEIEALNQAIKDFKADCDDLQQKYDILHVEKNRIENEKSEWQLKYDKCKIELAKGQTNFIKKLTDWFGGILAKILGKDE